MSKTTFTLSAEQMERLQKLQRDDQDAIDIFLQVFDIGLWQLEYRRKMQHDPTHRAKQAAKQKADRELLKRVKMALSSSDNPEVAVALGVGTRSSVS